MTTSNRTTTARAQLLADRCIGCGACLCRCPENAILNLGPADRSKTHCPEVDGCLNPTDCSRACAEKTIRALREMQGVGPLTDRVQVAIDGDNCTGCRECLRWCPVNAIVMVDVPAPIHD